MLPVSVCHKVSVLVFMDVLILVNIPQYTRYIDKSVFFLGGGEHLWPHKAKGQLMVQEIWDLREQGQNVTIYKTNSNPNKIKIFIFILFKST